MPLTSTAMEPWTWDTTRPFDYYGYFDAYKVYQVRTGPTIVRASTDDDQQKVNPPGHGRVEWRFSQLSHHVQDRCSEKGPSTGLPPMWIRPRKPSS